MLSYFLVDGTFSILKLLPSFFSFVLKFLVYYLYFVGYVLLPTLSLGSTYVSGLAYIFAYVLIINFLLFAFFWVFVDVNTLVTSHEHNFDNSIAVSPPLPPIKMGSFPFHEIDIEINLDVAEMENLRKALGLEEIIPSTPEQLEERLHSFVIPYLEENYYKFIK